ncbi:heptose II phosphotransferase [Cetobacterium ceti]|uniref:Heptose II phosphotransferase n=1 Tax=Cetobacterium ceti TaxID=180163 RepID=A0A1T4LRB0_9FUSO|nr:lipopolysaccharide core heptose(II) kinase RfaY [Cetobacterium ceti]SJZ57225.1 heptose II phosphotransferase [Cetobacterium ceti]
MKCQKYKGYNLYFFQDKYEKILEKILNKEYLTIEELKVTKRSYIAVIEIDEKKYVIKESRNEYRLLQRKILTLFKRGEVVNTLENIHRLREEYGIKEYGDIFGGINRRKYGMIDYNLLLMEYVGKEIFPETLDKMMVLMKKIHSLGYYHGDFNPSNFIVTESGNLKIVDTQGKKMTFGNYRAHYDMLTMKMDSFPEMEYPYKKNIYYYLALFMKEFKKNKYVEEFKRVKNRLRDKRRK